MEQMTALFMNDIAKLVGIAVAALVVYILKHLSDIAVFRKLNVKNMLKSDIVRQVVQYVEKEFETSDGQAKYEIALSKVSDFFVAHGMNVDKDEIKVMIESAVKGFELEFGNGWMKEENVQEVK